jgi:hypothetical protein
MAVLIRQVSAAYSLLDIFAMGFCTPPLRKPFATKEWNVAKGVYISKNGRFRGSSTPPGDHDRQGQ